jgi:hypothetical protein
LLISPEEIVKMVLNRRAFLPNSIRCKPMKRGPVASSRGGGSFLADLLQVTRDRLALLATEIGDTSKAPRLPEAVA